MLEAAAKFGAEFTVHHYSEKDPSTLQPKATKNQKFQRTERTCGQEGHLVARCMIPSCFVSGFMSPAANFMSSVWQHWVIEHLLLPVGSHTRESVRLPHCLCHGGYALKKRHQKK